MDMTLEQQGAYRNLLDEAALRGGPLPADDRSVAKACGDAKRWPKVRAVVLKRFTLEADGWHNETLDAVLKESARRAEKQRVWREGRNTAGNTAGNNLGNAGGNTPGNNRGSPDPDPDPDPLKSKEEEARPPPPDAARIATAKIVAQATKDRSTAVVAKARGTVAAVQDSRSKRPIFSGQRFTVFEFQLDQLQKLLGAAFDAFHVDEWFYELDARMASFAGVIPQRDNGVWLQTQTFDEAVRRGLPVAVSAPAAGKLTTRLAAAMENIRREAES